ncbi:right-handed parallel beta-helix repeat-containing protein [Pseudenhygromyxa sp. WMMC2535]|uniref:right-handed parallel beta-helix repeat-containing protein n=1 Tax=Pseudenhygromyxa sp. WMMC2535 TaxID=2712867 RepID=UPI0015572839|nr:right-handed parallel beta-helix repeat-containing protein [Pseudenhygromyxa sp. WMMC2535]NVB41363.1 right-handed parallel beta-helix repeat-containing protein [Pseudenhygromyxa sp. WMMC2535]
MDDCARTSWLLFPAFGLLLAACPSGFSDEGEAGESDESGSTDIDEDGSSSGGMDSVGESQGESESESESESDSGSEGESETEGGETDTGGDPPEAICDAPIALYDTGSPTAVIGDGSPESCTFSALKAAAEAGGTITFDCGADSHTITFESTIELPINTDTILDGEGTITFDGGGAVRLFHFEHPDWMNNPTKVVLQRLRLINGSAPPGEYFEQDPENPDCAYGYKEGSGGAIYMRNGVLHVLDSEFEGNLAALEGPDVGGGAIYVVGVPEVIISGSSFVNNRAANGGAVGMLFANPGIYNSLFEGNTAEGIGQNYVEAGCPLFNHDEQGGAGGNSGAVYFDGLNDAEWTYEICGSTFRENKANELGGALFRTPNVEPRQMLLDRCTFEGNTARLGGVSFIKDNSVTVRGSTFAHNRSGVNVAGDELGGPLGGLWINSGSVDLVNSTFYDNQPSGLDVEGSGGTVVNATFVDSRPGGDFSVSNSLFVDTTCNATLVGSNNLQWPEGGQDCVEGVSYGDPELGALGDNGGPTQTAVPAADGAAAGVGADCPTTDQRGETRDTASCAAGSVEP